MVTTSVCIGRRVLKETYAKVEAPNRDGAAQAALAIAGDGETQWEHARPPEE